MAHILIVDDDELIAEIASEVLIDKGHACGWVTSAEAAWRLLHRGRRPDLLLLDQNMPGISGITFLRRLRGSPQHYDLPVIMFTAMSGEGDEAQAIYAGAQDYVRKPFDPAKLTNCVSRLLVKRSASPQHKPLQTWLREQNQLERANAVPARRMV
ncbi:MAG: response regulator [Pseudomonadota bacterium]